MALLQQYPVFPQAPGYPASYSPDKIPKGAVIAFMPVVILPPEAYNNCDENTKHSSTNKNIDQFPLGVQPSPISFDFNHNTLFTGNARKDQCMCPCSCTQNIPEKLHKKRDINADDISTPLEPATVTSDANVVKSEATENKETKVTADSNIKADDVSTPLKPATVTSDANVVKSEATENKETKVTADSNINADDVSTPLEPAMVTSDKNVVKSEATENKETKVTSDSNTNVQTTRLTPATTAAAEEVVN